MLPGSESTNGWTKGMRRPYAIAAEATRFLVGVALAVTFVFVVLRVFPGSPYLSLIPHDPKYAGLLEQNIAVFALDQPLWVQYFVWILDVFTGRLGISYFYRLPVMDLVSSRLPVTLELLLGTALWAILLGTVLGWIGSSRRHRVWTGLSRGATLVLYAMPVFWSILLLSVGALEAWKVNLGNPFGTPYEPPRVTGFLTIDALLTGNWDYFWPAFWTTALLTLPGGLALCLPIASRVRNAVQRQTEREGSASALARRPFRERVPTLLAAVAGSLAVVMPFLVCAVVLEEWIGGRRGLGYLMFSAVVDLDPVLLQGVATILLLLALAVTAPFAILGAAFLRRPRPAVVLPVTVPERHTFQRWVSGVWGRLWQRSAIPFWLGLALVAAVAVLTYGASAFTPYGPLQRVADASCSTSSPPYVFLQPPCPSHPLGTDYFGHDIFSQVLYGGQYLIGETVQALALSTAIVAGLALLCAFLGRYVDVPFRVGLGAAAALPVVVVVLLVVFAGASLGFVAALTIAFVPILFRDARDLVAGVEWPRPLFGAVGAPRPGPLGRLVAAVAAVGPGFVARLPRRLAEMGLLLEAFTFIGLIPPTVVDWARITGNAVNNQAFTFNILWMVVPGALLFVYTMGLLVLSDGLRRVLTPEAHRLLPGPIPAAPIPAGSPPSPGTP